MQQMDGTNLPEHRYHPVRKPPSTPIPDSCEPTLKEETFHFIHPQHRLSQLTLPDPFTCSGCKEYGAGSRFYCQKCEFHLHDFCALSPATFKTHPLHPQHRLVFYSKPKTGGISWPRCTVCAKSVQGFVLHCTVCNFQMHPCCAMLSNVIILAVHPHSMELLSSTFKTSSSENYNVFTCGECKRKISGQLYGCKICNYYLDVVCAKNNINGLHTNGITNYKNPKNGILGSVIRLSSQVVHDLIAGLSEGIGEWTSRKKEEG